MPDLTLIRTFLDPHHAALAERFAAFAVAEIASRPTPADDPAARKEARSLVPLLGRGDWFRPIREQDFRACCLVR